MTTEERMTFTAVWHGLTVLAKAEMPAGWRIEALLDSTGTVVVTLIDPDNEQRGEWYDEHGIVAAIGLAQRLDEERIQAALQANAASDAADMKRKEQGA